MTWIPYATEEIVVKNKRCVSARKAAADLGLSYQYLRRLSAQGRVPGHIVAGRWWYNIRELQTALSKRA